MMNLRTFFFTIILVPKPKKEFVTIPDYDTTGDSETSPAAAPKEEGELPTCLLCVQWGKKVFSQPPIVQVLPLKKMTEACKLKLPISARYNKMTKTTIKDYVDIATLRRIDLTGNLISEIEDGAFSKLPLLEELNISELAKIPMLPAKLVSFNDNYNQLTTKACKHTTNIFSLKLTKMAYLYLGNNELETTPLPESLHIVHYMPTSVFQGNNTQYIRANMEEVRLDSNPLMLAKHPNSFVCLRALPIGPYH
uniref:Osteoglycin n=1 Tax=Oncorhynchus mykiss TaxID=8022 RepID=A0A8C7W1Y5_ONCMY